MQLSRFQRVEALFHEAADLSPTDRAAFLHRLSEEDRALRDEVEALLQEDDGANDEAFAGPIAKLRAAHQADDCLEPTRVGPYRILRTIGHGGMGAVYEAEQENPRRRVAIKLIRPGFSSRAVVSRFAHEVHILGRLRHPGIAQIYEAGVAEGKPFFAMELIRGLPLMDYARRNNLDTAARLRLISDVCEAVQHAHDNGVVHRDLKPGNILVDEDGRPKVLDFGVARALDDDERAATARTEIGQLIGTLAYMSPEQLAADAKAVDQRADVYALGVLLFEIVADRLPYDLQGVSLPEAARRVRDCEPSRLGSFGTRFRGDLETMVAKALEKDPGRRYASAAALAEDIRRHLSDLPIHARPPSAIYQLRKFARRHKVLVSAVVGVFASLVAGVVASVHFAMHAEARADAERAARTLAEANRQAARTSVYFADVRLAQQAWEEGRLDYMRQLLDEAARREPGDSDLRDFEWRHLRKLSRPNGPIFDTSAGEARSVAVSPDGRRLAAGCGNGLVRIWDIDSRRLIRTLTGHTSGVFHLEYSPDGRRIATAGWDGQVRIASVDGEAEPILRRYDRPILRIAWSSDGRRLIGACQPNLVRVWDALTGRELRVIDVATEYVTSLALSPDGGRVAASTGVGVVHVVSLSGDAAPIVLGGQAGWGNSVAFSPDGTRLASTSSDETVSVWNLATHELESKLDGHSGWVTSVAFSPDGRSLATGGRDATVRVWDLNSKHATHVFKGHSNWVMNVAFTPDGRHVASASRDGTARLWEIEAPRHDSSLTEAGQVMAVAFSPDGRAMAAGRSNGVIQLWRDGPTPVVLTEHAGGVFRIAFSPDGKRFASAGRDGTVRLHALDSDDAGRVLLKSDNWIVGLAFSPDGRRLITAGQDKHLRLLDPDTATVLFDVVACSKEPLAVAFSPDGKAVVPVGGDSVVPFHDTESGVMRASLEGHRDWIADVAFSPDGSQLATGSWDGTIRIWNLRGGGVKVLRGHGNWVTSVAFSHDGRRLVSGSYDRTVRLWETSTGREVLVLKGHRDNVLAVAFSPRGDQIVSGAIDGRLLTWEADESARTE